MSPFFWMPQFLRQLFLIFGLWRLALNSHRVPNESSLLELSGIGQSPDNSSLKGDDSSYVKDPVGFKGGLALFWNDTFEVSLVHLDDQFVDFIACDPRTSVSTHITCLHAPPSYQLRQEFWDTIRIIHAANHLPWICLGDFNDFLSPWEKMGKRPGPITVKGMIL